MTDTHVIPTQEILKTLHTLGYFGNQAWAKVKTITGARLLKAIKEYQEFHAIEEDGVGPVTASRMARKRCGLPDYPMTDAVGGVCKWPVDKMPGGVVHYNSALKLPGITAQQAAQAFDLAAVAWGNVCGIKLERWAVAKEANIIAKSGTGRANGLDNRGGTLAWSELPCNNDPNAQLSQMYDEAEDWSFNMAVAVITHELGHALGLPHLPKGNLMQPYYDPNLIKPQAGDINEMISRYGKPKPLPTPTPTVPGTPGVPAIDVSGTITINGIPYVLVPRG
jgi:hypothetical protein